MKRAFVTLLLCVGIFDAIATMQGFQNQASATIRGRVLSIDGLPVSGARVSVADPGSREPSVTADDGGLFEITVPAGRRWIRADKLGFMLLYYGQKSRADQPKSLSLAPGAVIENVDLVLSPLAAIEGRVVDPKGYPVEGAQVLAIGADVGNGRTNDLGEFRVPRLVPSPYLVRVHPPVSFDNSQSATRYVPTFAPGSVSAESATPIMVTPAAAVWTDVVLQSGRPVSVSGRVVGAAPLPPATVRLVVSFFAGNTSAQFEVAHAESTRDGTFILRGVPPGVYTVQVTVGAMFGDAEVSVGDGPVEGVEVRVGNGTTLNGQIDFDQAGGVPCRSIAVRSGRVDSSIRDEREGQIADVDRSGRFRLERVAGRQLLSFRCDGHPLPIKEMSVNGRLVRGGLIDTATLAEAATVRVTLGTDGGVIRGTVTTADGERCDPLVVIVRDEPDTWTPPNDFAWEVLVRGGEFRLAGLPTGRYFALVEPPTRQGRRLDALYFRATEARGTRFSISSGKEVRLDLKCA